MSTLEETTAQRAKWVLMRDKLQDAFLALSDPTVQAYDLDTGQSRQRVTRHELPWITAQIEMLDDKIDEIDRVLHSGTHRIVPLF